MSDKPTGPVSASQVHAPVGPDAVPSNRESEPTPVTAPVDSETEVPELPPQPATVMPFDAAGSPPPTPTVRVRHTYTAEIIVILIIVVLAVGAWVSYRYQQTGTFNLLTSQATPVPTPSDPTADLTAPVQAADDSLNDLNTNLSNADSGLSDQQGDLSE